MGIVTGKLAWSDANGSAQGRSLHEIWVGERDGKNRAPRTDVGPAGLSVAECHLIRGDLEPDIAAAVPAIDVLACGRFGEVELQWAWVEDARIRLEGHGRACSHGEGRYASSAGRVAADLRRRDVGHTGIRLVIERLAHVLPVRGASESREGIFVLLVTGDLLKVQGTNNDEVGGQPPPSLRQRVMRSKHRIASS